MYLLNRLALLALSESLKRKALVDKVSGLRIEPLVLNWVFKTVVLLRPPRLLGTGPETTEMESLMYLRITWLRIQRGKPISEQWWPATD